MDAVPRPFVMGASESAGSSLLSFEEVYRQFANPIRRFCVVQLRDAEAAQDVTADTFVKAFEAYDRVKPAPEQVHFWLLRIARNTALNYQRRVRLGMIFGRRHRHEPTIDVEADAQTRADLRIALDAVGRLP